MFTQHTWVFLVKHANSSWEILLNIGNLWCILFSLVIRALGYRVKWKVRLISFWNCNSQVIKSSLRVCSEFLAFWSCSVEVLILLVIDGSSLEAYDHAHFSHGSVSLSDVLGKILPFNSVLCRMPSLRGKSRKLCRNNTIC